MWQVFIILYVSYLILGPHWIVKSARGESLDIVQSPRQFLTRSVFISYVALLYTAWFLYKPSSTSFINALAVSGAATVAYHVRWGPEPMHILLNLFILWNGREYADPQTLLTLTLGVFYLVFHDQIYK